MQKTWLYKTLGLRNEKIFAVNVNRIYIRNMKKKSKAQKKVAKVMREGYEGKLHSGSKKGPVVTKPSQMKAIAMSEAGLSRKKHP